VNGLLLVDKPAGPTSHDVVETVRRMVKPARVGHAGTLDPAATGLLPLCIGAATRLARFVGGGPKEYEGEIVFGVETETYDAAGKIVRESEVEGLSLASIAAEAVRLTGDLDQVPPPWSAKKIGGRRAYDLARRGEKATLAPCRVRVDRFEILDYRRPRATFRISCSGGTYVRSLAHDLGTALGCGGHLGSLRRTANGPFRVADSHSMESVEEAARAGRLGTLLTPLESLDLGLPSAIMTEAGLRLARAGRFVPGAEIGAPAPTGPGLARILAPGGGLVGIGEISTDGSAGVHPRIILPASEPPAGA